MNTAQLAAEYNTAKERADALLAGNPNPEQVSEAKALVDKAKELKAQIEQARQLEALRAETSGLSTMTFGIGTTDLTGQANQVADALAPTPGMTHTGSAPAPKPIRIPALCARMRPAYIKDDDGKPSPERAFMIGKWIQATLCRNRQAFQWCQEHGVGLYGMGPSDIVQPLRQFAQSEDVNTAGGFLVFDEFERTIIDLKETYGLARRYCDVVPMSSDTKLVPRRTGGVTAYFIGEGAALTESSLSWDQVQLVAKKLAAMVFVSNELNEDAIISMADKIAFEIAWASALTEDNCLFNGDGTNSTATFDGTTVYYGGITGVREKLKGLSGTIGDIAGLVVGTGNAYSELTLTDFHAVKGRLPEYAAQMGDVAWYCSRVFYHEVMEKLMMAQGGVTALETAMGRNDPVFLGHPVRITQVMPKTEANSQVCALFGSLRLSTMLGDRRQTTLAVSDQYRFANDQLAIRGTSRFDINVHDVGNASSTASSRIAGPIVGLITAAS